LKNRVKDAEVLIVTQFEFSRPKGGKMRESQLKKLRAREKSLTRWLRKNAPRVVKEQRHLDDETVEQAYWHYGYLIAIRDILHNNSSRKN
jgi:hypothetical protein